MGGGAKNSLKRFLLPLTVGDLPHSVAFTVCTQQGSERMWKYDISPLGCLQSDMVVWVSLRHHQSRRMFTSRTNKNPTWHSRRRSRLLLTNWESESLLFQHWCNVYMAWPLSYPLPRLPPAENTPWQTAFLWVPSFPHYSCSLSPDTQALRD